MNFNQLTNAKHALRTMDVLLLLLLLLMLEFYAVIERKSKKEIPQNNEVMYGLIMVEEKLKKKWYGRRKE